VADYKLPHSSTSAEATELVSKEGKFSYSVLDILQCYEISREAQRLKVCENRLLRSIFVPKREEVVGGWRRLHNEELHNLYASPNIFTYQIKEDERGGACSKHGKDEKCIKISVGKGRDHSEDLGVDEETILEWILGKWDGNFRLDSCGSG
jgi:hypothetical protein